MATAAHHVSVRLLYPFSAALSEEGVDLDRVLEAAAIPRSTYDDQESRVPYTTCRRFHFAAAAASRNSALGLAAARHARLARFQALEYYVGSNTHMRSGLDGLVHHEGVLSEVSALTLEPRSDGLLLRVEPASKGAHRIWFEFVVASLFLAGRRILCTAPGKPGRSLPWFAYAAPACAAAYEAFFGRVVRFNAPACGILIPPPMLGERLEGADPRLREVLETQLADASLRGTPSSLLDRVRTLLGESLSEGHCDMDAIAARLHMSRSTLRRRLNQERTSYRALLQEVRQTLALRYLERRDLSIGEVAYLLGYDDSTSFHKAFRQWTASTPSDYRMALHAEAVPPATTSLLRNGAKSQ